MFLGWYDPDRKKAPRQKLEEAMERYEEKFGKPAKVVLTNPEDAAALREPTRAYPGSAPVKIREVRYVARWTLYLGTDRDLRQLAA